MNTLSFPWIIIGPLVLSPVVYLAGRLGVYESGIKRRFSFVRVDFLLGDDERLYLSELTFSPGNGNLRWPGEMDAQFGALWNLDK